jgi:prolyl-tRNA synthetase
MRYSRLFAKTLREVHQDLKSVSHLLLLKGGYIRALGQGLFSILPLGLRVIKNLEKIIAEEMDALGGQEITVPLINPRELWIKSGRDHMVDRDMIRFSDRSGKDLVISPTHEEAVVDLVRNCLTSYRDLPFFLYQFQLKYRDEDRPRHGLIRAKEFVMKDGYSFHRSYADLNNFFPKMYAAYMRVFNRCGVPIHAAESGVGYMGGERAYEFLMPCDCGDDMMITCQKCGYTANRDVAVGVKEYFSGPLFNIERVVTSGCSTMSALSRFLGRPLTDLAKSMVYLTPKGLVMAVVRGDYEVSFEKLSRRLNLPILRLATPDELETVGLIPGYLSPLGNLAGVPVVVDDMVANSSNLVYGGNETGVHLLNVNYGRDYETEHVTDISLIKEENACLHCGGKLRHIRSVELGNIFKLGDYYSRSMELFFHDESGNKIYPYMGSYGIGIGRLMAAVVEANHDERGIVWPLPLAPYKIFLMAVGKSLTIKKTTEELAEKFGDRVLYDDREESAGVKFKDADILGIPLRVLVSTHGLQEGVFEVRERRTGMTVQVPKDKIIEVINDLEKGKMPV